MKNKSRIVLLSVCLGTSIAAGAKIPQIPGLPDLNDIPFIQQLIQLVPGLNDALESIPDLSQLPDWAGQQLPGADEAAKALTDAGFDPALAGAVGDDFMTDVLKNAPPLSQVVNEAKNDPNPPKTPMYDRKNIYDMSEIRPVPHAKFITVDSKKPTKVPYSLDTETVRVGKDLRAAWQRLEDRSYWHALVKLNNPAMIASHCTIDWKSGDETLNPDLTINVQKGMYPKELDGKIPTQEVNDKLRMDKYSILPFVPNDDYCSGVDPDFTVMFIPGTCVYTPEMQKLFCIEGEQETLNPLAPRPIDFNYQEALKRIADAIKDTETDYLKEYNTDVLKALKPTAKFYPTLWDNMFTGSVIAPTTTLKPDLASLLKSAKEAGKNLGGVFKSTAPIYYAQGVASNSLTEPLRVHILPRRNDVLGVPNPPGVWPLEEYKRTFKIQPLPVADRFGYTTLFRAWMQPTVTLLPEPLSAKPLRQMIYMAGGVNVILTLPVPIPVPVPAPILIKEFAAGLPYVGVKARFTWENVAEGYEVPGVNGKPIIDYPIQ